MTLENLYRANLSTVAWRITRICPSNIFLCIPLSKVLFWIFLPVQIDGWKIIMLLIYWFLIFFHLLLNNPQRYNTTLQCLFTYNAPINVNPGGGGVRARGGDLTNFKFFDQIPQGGKRKVNQKCQKRPHPRGKNLNKQYYIEITSWKARTKRFPCCNLFMLYILRFFLFIQL